GLIINVQKRSDLLQPIQKDQVQPKLRGIHKIKPDSRSIKSSVTSGKPPDRDVRKEFTYITFTLTLCYDVQHQENLPPKDLKLAGAYVNVL
ncbi:hypothetical protein NPIL_296691, partial [Nephila pilipes]